MIREEFYREDGLTFLSHGITNDVLRDVRSIINQEEE